MRRARHQTRKARQDASKAQKATRKPRGVLVPFFGTIGLVLGLSIVAFAIALWLVGPSRLVEMAIVNWLRFAGFDQATVRVTHLGFDAVELADLSAGTDHAVAFRNARLSFADGGLLSGPALLEVDGLRLVLQINESGVSIGPMALGKDAGDGVQETDGEGFRLAGFPVHLTDLAFAIETPVGAIDATSQTEIVFDSSGGRGELRLHISPRPSDGAALAPHEGALRFTLGGTGELAAGLTLAPLAVSDGKAARAVSDGKAARAVSDGKAAHAVIAGELSGSLANRSIAFAFDIESLVMPAFGLAVRQTRVSGQAAQAEEAFVVSFDECGQAQGVVLSSARLSITAETLSLCATSADEAVARWTETGGGLFAEDRSAIALSAVIPVTEIAVLLPDQDFDLGGHMPAIRLTADFATDGRDWKAAIDTDGGALFLNPLALQIGNLVLSGQVESREGAAMVANARLSRATLSDPSRSPRIAPITLAGDFNAGDDAIAFSLDATAEPAGKIATIAGRHNLGDGTGAADAMLTPMAFEPGGLQPDQLLPMLRGMVAAATGKISATAEFTWSDAGVQSGADVTLEELGLRTELARLDGVNGRLKLSSLLPPQTAGLQEIRVRMMDLGLPLPDGRLRVRLDPDGSIAIEDARWSFVGGTVGLDSAVFGGGRDDQSLTLVVDNVDLEGLLRLLEVEGLTGDGRISGKVPVHLEASRQRIEGAYLTALAPGGRVRYRSEFADAAGELDAWLQVALSALEDFHYDALDATLNGDINGELSLQVHLKGRNPALYGGKPIDLNIATDGPFVEMLRNGLFAYRRTE